MSVNRKKLPKAIRIVAEGAAVPPVDPVRSDRPNAWVASGSPAACVEAAPLPNRSGAGAGSFAVVPPAPATLPPASGASLVVSRPDAARAGASTAWRASRAQAIIERHATYSAVGGILPLPLLNVGAVTSLILRMVKRLSELYGVPFERDRARALVIGLMGGAMPTGLATVTSTTLAYVLPGSGLLGLAVSSVAASACTRGIGRIVVQKLESGSTLHDL